MTEVTYDRPVGAKLMVRLDNGDEWEATAEDAAKFGYVNALAAYWRFTDALTTAFTKHGLLNDGLRDLTRCEINPLRYLVECAVVYSEFGDTLTHMCSDDEETGDDTIAELANIERDLRAARSEATS